MTLSRAINIKLDGKIYNSSSFLKNLDKNKSLEERQVIIDDICNHKYWEESSTQVENGVISTKTTSLSSETKYGQDIERLANYLLYTPEELGGERMNKGDVDYNFYKSYEEFEKTFKKRQTGFCDILSDDGFDGLDDKIDFLLDENRNYYHSKEQKITKKDESKKYIYDYVAINNWVNMIKLNKEESKKLYAELTRRYGLISEELDILESQVKNSDGKIEFGGEYTKILLRIDDLKLSKNKLGYFKNSLTINLDKKIKGYNSKDCLLVKDALDKTVYLKIFNNGFTLDKDKVSIYDKFDFFDKIHVKSLLAINPDKVRNLDIIDLVCDIQLLIKNCEFDDIKKEIIKLYRRDKSMPEIADIIGINRTNVDSQINTIVNKIINEFEIVYENWYYLNICNGKYKKCSKCGEIKIVQRFAKNPDSKDGYRNNCNKCRK